MESDKEEARRALGIADRKLSENDYNGAKKFANKAHSLYPELDGLKQMLMMINVYISAANKVNGGREADWYRILNVDPLADDEAVKKQYKKLALLLHPDKNRFNAAEGAFKLVLEAWCVLSDSCKRIAYARRRKPREAETGRPKPPNPHKPASNNGNRNARDDVHSSNKPPAAGEKKPASSDRNQKVKVGVNWSDKPWRTFWTMCSKCKTQCEYVREPCLNKAIRCPNCGLTFIATEKIPWTSFVNPVNLSSSPQQKQQRKKTTTKKTNTASSSSGRKSSATATDTQKTPQASDKTQATNKSTRPSSFGRTSSPSVSATQKTPKVSFWKPVVNQQQQQWNAQDKSTSRNTRFSFSFKATSSSRNATSSKRVVEESQETVSAADRILKRPRTQM